jgi:hypothetical protein
MRETPFVELGRYERIGPRQTVIEVVECPELDQGTNDEAWRQAVASERSSANVHFFRRMGEAFGWWPVGSALDIESAESLDVLAADLVRRGLVGADKPLLVQRSEGGSLELEPVAEGQHSDPTVERVITPAGLDERIALDAKESLPRSAIGPVKWCCSSKAPTAMAPPLS